MDGSIKWTAIIIKASPKTPIIHRFMNMTQDPTLPNQRDGSALEVLLTFLKLGLTSFGGPVAHLGYFRAELVARREWVSDNQFSQLLAICQFLPGPASSQLGFCLGLLRAGWLGALCAFLAFTLPSVLLLMAFASAVPLMSGPLLMAVIHGLKLVACVIVADALLGMSKNLCPDARRKTIALLAAAVLLMVSSALTQLLVVATAAIVGIIVLRKVSASDPMHSIPLNYGRSLGFVFIAAFIGLLLLLPLFASTDASLVSVADAFYRAGALVFGGGHVVLPLLEDSMVASGWVSADEFLAGYGASQAIPGPMFAFSAYLGSLLSEGNVVTMALTALVFMFLPGFLLVAGALPFWRVIANNPVAAGGIAGVNAAAVWLLGAALYDPIFTAAITQSKDLAIALAGFAILAVWRLSPLWLVLWCVGASVATLGW